MTWSPSILDKLQFKISGSFGKAHCEVGWCWQPPVLTDIDLWFALSGEGEMQINDEKYPIVAGTCFVVRPEDMPIAVQNPENRLRVIFFHFQIYEAGKQVKPNQLAKLCPNRHTRIVETFYIETLLYRLLELEERNSPWKHEEYNLIMKQLFIILHRLGSEEEDVSLIGRHRILIKRVIAHVKENPGRRYSHEELAVMVNLSATYLSKIFKRQIGVSLKEYMTDIRLERALYLIQESGMNVSQVAEALGYANVYLFSKQFKQRHGTPPSKFKNTGLASKPHGLN